MTVTLTDRLGLTRWGSDSDAWSREQIVANFDALDNAAAVSPQAYGAAGDDVTNDTADLQAAITAAAAFGAAVDGNGLTYLIDATLNVPAGSTLRNMTLRCATAGVTMVEAAGDDTTFDRVSFVGRHTVATYATAEWALYAHGASGTAPIRNLTVTGCTFHNLGMYALFMSYVDGFKVDNCDFGDLGFQAIAGLSVWRGVITRCTIDTVLNPVEQSSTGYGIGLSRREVDSFVTDPNSHHVIVEHNLIRNIPGWEGIDTHGGHDMTFAHNVIENCKVGIAVLGVQIAGQVWANGPERITVIGNVIDSTVTDGSREAGINVTGSQGATSTDPAVGYAKGIVVLGNIIKGHGNQATIFSGAIYARNTLGLVVASNQFIDCSPAGVSMFYDNRQATITGNTFVDPWSTAYSSPACIQSRGDNNTATITGNVLHKAGKVATYVAIYGVYTSTGPTTQDLTLGGGNDFRQATTDALRDADGTTIRHRVDAISTYARALYGANGAVGAPSYTFTGDPDTGFYWVTSGAVGYSANGVLKMRLNDTTLQLLDGYNVALGSTTGTQFGTGTGHKLSFWGATPIAKPAAGTELKAALASIGLLYDGTATDLNLDGGTLTGGVAFTPTGGIAATTVADALAELDTEKATNAALTAHIDDTVDAHDATAISYAGAAGLSATDVEAALDELDTEKAPKAAPTFTGTTTVDDLTATGNVLLGNAPTDLIGFYGAAGVARPGTYNLTGSADRTLGAYASDAESAAYAGVPAALADAATRAELNQLRAAYENLRTYVEDLGGVAIATATDLKTLGLVG